MTAIRNKTKLLYLLCALLLLIACSACNTKLASEQASTEPSATTTLATQPTTEPTTEEEPTSTVPTESTTVKANVPSENRFFDVAELPPCENEVSADNASIPIVIRLKEEDGSTVAYRSTWDITNGTLSEMNPCFSYPGTVNGLVNAFILDYWDGDSLFYADDADTATLLGDYILERTPRGIPISPGNRCRFYYSDRSLRMIQEGGELLPLPAATPPTAQELGLPMLAGGPLYAHYDGEKILLLWHGFANHCLDILYTWYSPDDTASVEWKWLTFQTEYAAVSGTNSQACYCDGFLYIPSYNDVFVINMETEEVFRVADIDRYVASVAEFAERPWTKCVEIIGCYEDIVVASLTLYGADGTNHYHELAIRKGRIIGSYSRAINSNNGSSLCLMDEAGEVLFADAEIASKSAIPNFPRID